MGKVFVFIKYEKLKYENSTLCIAKIDGTSIEQLTDGKGIITEAVFSRNGTDIIFCMAKTYSKNSPIGITNAHEFDIYTINRFSKKVTKITSLGAYGVRHISEVNSDYILFDLISGQKGGIYLIERNNPNTPKKIVPANNPRGDESYYGCPNYNPSLDILIYCTIRIIFNETF